MCGTQALDDINKWECTLYVPDESIADYKTAAQWKEFFFIEQVPTDTPETWIEDVEETTTPDAIYYDLRGNRVANPAKGVYVKVQDGRATRVRI